MTPDTIIVNGKFITFADAAAPVNALAIAGDRILAVGQEREIRALAGHNTRVINAQKGTVLPGFIDSHVHLFLGSAQLQSLNLHGIHGYDQLSHAVRAFAHDRPNDRLLLATAADYHIMGADRATTRQELDSIIADRPFAMLAADQHTAWANTAALEAAGILHGGNIAEGAEIVLDNDGTATGMLVEFAAYKPVVALTPTGGREAAGLLTGADPVPPATSDERLADQSVIRSGLQYCASQGITTLHNMDGNFYQLELLDALDQAGDLLCRTEVPFHLKNYDPLDRLQEAESMRQRYHSDRLWCNRVKMFMDGVIESYTALMHEPYPGRPDTHGQALFSAEHFNAACTRADAAGFQIATHAIGDLAVHRTLNGYAAAKRANGKRDSRHRVEHIEVVHPDDLPRFAELGVIASMQPLHSPAGGFLEAPTPGDLLREQQLAYAYAWNKVRDAGAHLCFSTDWPVVPVDVMPSIQAAVATKALPAPWPESAQTLYQALSAYTRDNAFTEFSEQRKGRLAPGFLADIVIMANDLERMAPHDLAQAKVAMTLCGGRETYVS